MKMANKRPCMFKPALMVGAWPGAHSMMVVTAVSERMHTMYCSILQLNIGDFALHHGLSWHL